MSLSLNDVGAALVKAYIDDLNSLDKDVIEKGTIDERITIAIIDSLLIFERFNQDFCCGAILRSGGCYASGEISALEGLYRIGFVGVVLKLCELGGNANRKITRKLLNKIKNRAKNLVEPKNDVNNPSEFATGEEKKGLFQAKLLQHYIGVPGKVFTLTSAFCLGALTPPSTFWMNMLNLGVITLCNAGVTAMQHAGFNKKEMIVQSLNNRLHSHQS